MSTHVAGPHIQRRVDHIQRLTAEIAARQHIAAHLIASTFRAGYYFFTLACLTAGVVGLANGRTQLVATWGVAGVALLVLLIGFKVGERVSARLMRELREEFSKGRRA